jgi:hypothetical protein
MRIHRAIAGAAFVCAIVIAAGAANAFEFTSVGGTDADGSPHYQDPDQKVLPSPLGGLQFDTKSSSSGQQSSDADSGVPPWRIQPPPPTAGFLGSFGSRH